MTGMQLKMKSDIHVHTISQFAVYLIGKFNSCIGETNRLVIFVKTYGIRGAGPNNRPKTAWAKCRVL